MVRDDGGTEESKKVGFTKREGKASNPSCQIRGFDARAAKQLCTDCSGNGYQRAPLTGEHFTKWQRGVERKKATQPMAKRQAIAPLEARVKKIEKLATLTGNA